MNYFFSFDKIFSELEKEIQKDSNYITKRRWYEYKELDDKRVLMYDVSGIKENDLKVLFDNDGYQGRITISGETKTEFGNYKCNDRFSIPISYMGSGSSYFIENGILYIEIVADKKNKFELKKKNR